MCTIESTKSYLSFRMNSGKNIGRVALIYGSMKAPQDTIMKL